MGLSEEAQGGQKVVGWRKHFPEELGDRSLPLSQGSTHPTPTDLSKNKLKKTEAGSRFNPL